MNLLNHRTTILLPISGKSERLQNRSESANMNTIEISKLSVKEARDESSIGKKASSKAGCEHVATQKPDLASSKSTMARARVISRSLPTPTWKTTNRKSNRFQPVAVCLPKVKSTSRAVVVKKRKCRQRKSLFMAGRIQNTIRCKRNGIRLRNSASGPIFGPEPIRSAPSPESATASAIRFTNFYQEQGFPLRPHARDHGQRLRRGRRDVSGHHDGPGTNCQKQD